MGAPLQSANWRTWCGTGRMPVVAHAEVAVLWRNGLVHKSRAGALCWQWDHSPDGEDPEDIVAFRLRSAA